MSETSGDISGDSSAAEDASLVADSLRGSDAAFAELVRKYKNRVFATASRYARDEHQLQDLAQEIFLRLHKNLGKFRGDAPFSHWLSRVAASTCLDFLRKERRNRETTALESLAFELPDPTTAAAFQHSQACDILRRAMAPLTPEDHWILTLCELEERPVREVAQITGWSESNVKVRAFRARQNLRKILVSQNEA
jgi:RNA polymerase sigma-70 factor (ECF subfamily)